MQEIWITRAALYELLAKSFLYLEREIVEALVQGDYREAMTELLEHNGLGQSQESVEIKRLEQYQGADAELVFHALRREQTRLYIGKLHPLVCPFAGTWDMEKKGLKPLLFVGAESMAIERFMRSCGIGQPQGTNEPLDHIGSMLEFLQHLCLIKAGVVLLQEGVTISDNACEEFYERHFIGFAREFAARTIEVSSEDFYVVAAQVLRALPTTPPA
jgi:TorA maturation chaperone TorD